MSVLSKHLSESSCFYLAHPWCRSCVQTFIEIWGKGFKESIKIYSIVYLLSFILNRKKVKDIFLLPKEIFRSSLFLSLNGGLFVGFICLLRRLMKFNFLSVAFYPALFASSLSVALERNSRRQQLTVYMVNIAVQTVYGILRNKNIVKDRPHGELFVFSIASSLIMNFYVQQKLPAYLFKLLGYLIGKKEIISHQPSHEGFKRIREVPIIYRSKQCSFFTNILLNKTEFCPHEHSCIEYILSGFPKPAVTGLVIQWIFLFIRHIRSTQSISRKLIRKDSFGLGMFLGIFSVLFRFFQCLQRNIFHLSPDRYMKYQTWFSTFSGFLAGFSKLFYPSPSLSMYSLSKAVEFFIRHSVTDKSIFGLYSVAWIIGIYSIATAFVFHTALWEPSSIPQTYLKFLVRMTDGRITSFAEEIQSVNSSNN